jgi:nucleoid-associated protein YgaU
VDIEKLNTDDNISGKNSKLTSDKSMYFSITDKKGAVIDMLYFPYVPPLSFGKMYNIKTYDSVNGKQFSSYAGYGLNGATFTVEFPTSERTYSTEIDGIKFMNKVDDYIRKQYKFRFVVTGTDISFDCYVEKMHPKIDDATFDAVIDFELIERDDPEFLAWNPEKNSSKNDTVNTSNGKDPSMISTAPTVAVREDATIFSKKVGELQRGTKVTYVSERDGWFKIKYGKLVGYVSSNYLEYEHQNKLSTMVVTANQTTMKKESTVLSEIVAKLIKGDVVKFISEKDGWVKADFNGKIGYISHNSLAVEMLGRDKDTGTQINKKYHTVKLGDNLYDIAEKYYKKGKDWPKIKNNAENQKNYPKLKNSNVINAGWKLLIP